MHTHKYTHTHTHAHIHARTLTHKHSRTLAHTHSHMHSHSHTHTHIHTHARARARSHTATLQPDVLSISGIYFELTDSLGHRYGPNSRRLLQVIADLDPIMDYLAESLTTFALNDVNLMLVSDHGMTSISRSRVINLNGVIEPSAVHSIMTDVAVANIYTKPGKEIEVLPHQQRRRWPFVVMVDIVVITIAVVVTVTIIIITIAVVVMVTIRCSQGHHPL